MRKKLVVYSLLVLLMLPLVVADLMGTLTNVWDKIISIGNLEVLGLSNETTVVGVMRLLIGFLVFTIFFAVASLKEEDGKMLGLFTKNQAMLVALIIAIITGIFLPNEILLASGTILGTIVSLLLVGGPVIALFYWLFKIPGEGKEDDRKTYFLKLLICLVIFYILTILNNSIIGAM